MNNRLSNRTERLAQIERMLFRSAHGMRVMEIAGACGIDGRPFSRDMDPLGEIGAPIWKDEGVFGMARKKFLAPVRLNFNEAFEFFTPPPLLPRHSDQQNPHVI